MVAVEAEPHLGLIPRGLESSYCAVYKIGGRLLVNKVGTADEAELFILGVRRVDDMVAGPYRHARRSLARYTHDKALVRTIYERDKHSFFAADVLEPLPGHPLYNAEAEANLFFEGHHFKPNLNRSISPEYILMPDQKLVKPYVELGRLSILAG